MDIYRKHFESDLPHHEAAELFRRSVDVIELSISSYCNRRCPYCPNSQVDRMSQRLYMHDQLFSNIVSTLAEIDYSGRIAIHRYNEPLADRDYALGRLTAIRQHLPKAKILIHSNGDYLTREYLEALRDIGVNAIGIAIHSSTVEFDEAKLQKQLSSRLNAFGFPYVVSADGRGAKILMGGDMHVDASYQNMYAPFRDGNLPLLDRAQSLGVQKKYNRTSPCLSVFQELQIDYDGSMWPCCNFHPDFPEHQKFKVGQLVTGREIFSEWTNKNYVSWRKEMLSFKAKSAPCNTCDYKVLQDSPMERMLFAQLRTHLDLPMN